MKQKKLYTIDEIMELAQRGGMEDNFFFMTTLDRYQTQLRILEELKKAIDDEGMLVTKEYVRGRGNLYTNPAVGEFNRTTDSANKTVSTLLRIIRSLESADKSEPDPLMEMINGDGE